MVTTETAIGHILTSGTCTWEGNFYSREYQSWLSQHCAEKMID
jgi:hypothetical protein